MNPRDKATREFIQNLCFVDEALAALDQAAGDKDEMAAAARAQYAQLLKARDLAIRNWNGDIGDLGWKVYRCSQSGEGDFYTVADGPCDVWVSEKECVAEEDVWCVTCAEKAFERQQARRMEG